MNNSFIAAMINCFESGLENHENAKIIKLFIQEGADLRGVSREYFELAIVQSYPEIVKAFH